MAGTLSGRKRSWADLSAAAAARPNQAGEEPSLIDTVLRPSASSEALAQAQQQQQALATPPDAQAGKKLNLPGPEGEDRRGGAMSSAAAALNGHHFETLNLNGNGAGAGPAGMEVDAEDRDDMVPTMPVSGLHSPLIPDGCQFVRTKIVCTLGPASREVATLESLLRAGMNVARFNFSHGSHEYHQETLDRLRQASANTGILCAVLLDTKGPEIRTGFLKDGKAVKLEKGQEVTVTTDYDYKGDASKFAMSYKSLPRDVAPGGIILCADGSITLTVLSCDPAAGTVQCRCENTAVLGERKNVNLPGVVVDLPTVTDKDVDDILHWGVPNGVDFIAASFVRKGSDVLHIRKLLGPKHADRVHIISKVENQEGLVNFDSILKESDGIMVARGDLGMEIPTEKIFLAQKLMIYKCNAAGKPVVTATQMLESMTKSPRPTRAEATDVANAVLDGTDAVMLSGETAAGAYPLEAVTVMARICREAEESLDYHGLYKAAVEAVPQPMTPMESLASSAVRQAISIRASLILVLTHTGLTARLVAKYRPPMPILSVAVPTLEQGLDMAMTVSDPGPATHGLVVRGLVPVLGEGTTQVVDSEGTEDIVHRAITFARDRRGLCKNGDAVIILHRLSSAWVIKVEIVQKTYQGPRMGHSSSDFGLDGALMK